MRGFDSKRKNKGMLTTFIVGGVGVVLVQHYLRPVVESMTGAKGK